MCAFGNSNKEGNQNKRRNTKKIEGEEQTNNWKIKERVKMTKPQIENASKVR